MPIEYKYTLTFYNVGLLGGSSFGEATLQSDTIALGPGWVMVKNDNSLDGMGSVPASDTPVFAPKIYKLQFSGGPYGVFTENGKTVGQLDNAGNGATFSKYVAFGTHLTVEKPNAFAPWLATTSSDDSGARFSSLSGQVEKRPDADPKGWVFCKMNTVLSVNDHVKTGEDSSAIIGFADLSTFLLKSESEIVITTEPKTNSKLSLLAGNIWVNIKKMAVDGTMEIDMT